MANLKLISATLLAVSLVNCQSALPYRPPRDGGGIRIGGGNGITIGGGSGVSVGGGSGIRIGSGGGTRIRGRDGYGGGYGRRRGFTR